MIGNNLANAQTVGFKSSDVVFGTQFLQTLSLGAGPTANNNDHYEQLEANHVNLRDELVRVTQSSVNGLPMFIREGDHGLIYSTG